MMSGNKTSCRRSYKQKSLSHNKKTAHIDGGEKCGRCGVFTPNINVTGWGRICSPCKKNATCWSCNKVPSTAVSHQQRSSFDSSDTEEKHNSNLDPLNMYGHCNICIQNFYIPCYMCGDGVHPNNIKEASKDSSVINEKDVRVYKRKRINLCRSCFNYEACVSCGFICGAMVCKPCRSMDH